MLPKKHRLTHGYRMQEVARHGQKIHTDHFVISRLKNKDMSLSIGFIAGKKVGNAVYRNKGLRLLRAAVSDNLSSFQDGYDYVLVCRKGITAVSSIELSTHVEAVLNRYNN